MSEIFTIQATYYCTWFTISLFDEIVYRVVAVEALSIIRIVVVVFIALEAMSMVEAVETVGYVARRTISGFIDKIVNSRIAIGALISIHIIAFSTGIAKC